jgi:hypothetical protein
LDNGSNRNNCADTIRRATKWSPLSGSKDTLEVSCLDQFRDCFANNLLGITGQCCECDAGWSGYNCNTANCNPACAHGSCISPDTCSCSSGWTGSLCDMPICSSCVNGVCVEPSVCECYYGWRGSDCNTREV